MLHLKTKTDVAKSPTNCVSVTLAIQNLISLCFSIVQGVRWLRLVVWWLAATSFVGPWVAAAAVAAVAAKKCFERF